MYTLSVITLLTTFISYGLGWYMIIFYTGIQFILGFLLITHGLIYSCYYYHELAHGLVTKNKRIDNALGILLGHLNGSCYFSYYELQSQHLEHHKNKVDVILVPLLSVLYTNQILFNIVKLLEFFYIPAWHLVVSWRAILSPWWKHSKRQDRLYTLFIILTRFTCGICLVICGKSTALIAYCMSYCIMIHISRIADIFGHIYELVSIDTIDTVNTTHKGKKYDMYHTFSIYDISVRYGFLQTMFNSLLFLNFTHHNAHHFSPTVPWYLLHQVNRQLEVLIPEAKFSLSFWSVLYQYHLLRVERLSPNAMAGKPIWDTQHNKMNISQFMGASEASFLVIEV